MVEVEVLLPYSAGEVLDSIHKLGTVSGVEYTEAGTRVTALVPQSLAGRLQEYSSGPLERAAAAV
jgi:GTPase